MTTKLKLICVAALTLFALASHAAPRLAQRTPKAQAERRASSASVVLFSVSRYEENFTIDPIVLIGDGGRYAAPPIGSGDPAEADAEAKRAQRFIRDYFRPGRKYRLLFGGGEAGSAEVLKYIEPGCVGMEASVRAQTSARIGGQVFAIATNSDALGKKSGSRRAPTDAERAKALEFARKTFERNRVSPARIARMETNNLTAVDLNGDGQAELIGSFIITGEAGVEESLFQILEPSRGSYSATLDWFHRGKEVEATYRRLIDALDIDGDGVAEVVAQGIYYESHDYFIYRKQNGRWRAIYQGGGGGC